MGKVPPRTHHIDRRALQIVADSAAGSADDDLLSTAAVADWLGVSTQFLEIGRSKSYGPPYKRLSARRIMYRRGDVLAWLKKRTHGGTAEYAQRRARR
jgi:hypothetical protein